MSTSNLTIETKSSMIAAVGDEGYLVVFRVGQDSEGRGAWGYKFLGPAAGTFHRVKAPGWIKSGVAGVGDNPREIMTSLASFLMAFEESDSSTSENWDLFPRSLHSWVRRNIEHIQDLHMQLEPESYGLKEEGPIPYRVKGGLTQV